MSYKNIPISKLPDGARVVDPINCIWLDTVYWKFPWNFGKANIGDAIASNAIRFPPLDSEFYLRAHKASAWSLIVQIHRRLIEDIPDDGFLLHFIVSVAGVRSPQMDEGFLSSSDEFLGPFGYLVPATMMDDRYWIVKCYCEMSEMSGLDNEASGEQNRIMELLVNDKDIPEEREYKLACMTGLLNRTGFTNMFTGRQPYDFALKKAKLIERALGYAHEILLLLECAKIRRNVPGLSNAFDKILQCIYKSESRDISDIWVIDLHCMAYRYGLRFLQILCRQYMKLKLQDINFFISVILTCEWLCEDSPLADILTDEFPKRLKEIRSSTMWTESPFREFILPYTITDISLNEEVPNPPYRGYEIAKADERLINIKKEMDEMDDMLSTAFSNYLRSRDWATEPNLSADIDD